MKRIIDEVTVTVSLNNKEDFIIPEEIEDIFNYTKESITTLLERSGIVEVTSVEEVVSLELDKKGSEILRVYHTPEGSEEEYFYEDEDYKIPESNEVLSLFE